MSNCLHQTNELPLVGRQLEVASGEGSAEEGEGSSVLVQDSTKPRTTNCLILEPDLAKYKI